METINILLLICSFIAYFASFGGKTWEEGNSPIIKRITLRGFIALIAIIFSFTLGVTKEIKTRKTLSEKDEIIAKLTKIENVVRGIPDFEDAINNKIINLNLINSTYKLPNPISSKSTLYFFPKYLNTKLVILYKTNAGKVFSEQIDTYMEKCPYFFKGLHLNEELTCEIQGTWKGTVEISEKVY